MSALTSYIKARPDYPALRTLVLSYTRPESELPIRKLNCILFLRYRIPTIGNSIITDKTHMTVMSQLCYLRALVFYRILRFWVGLSIEAYTTLPILCTHGSSCISTPHTALPATVLRIQLQTRGSLVPRRNSNVVRVEFALSMGTLRGEIGHLISSPSVLIIKNQC